MIRLAQINITITEEEKEQMLKAIRQANGKTISVAKLAKSVGMNPNRARFVIEELLQENKIKRNVTKAYNRKYIRYSYEIL